VNAGFRPARASKVALLACVAFGGMAESGFAAPVLGPLDVRGSVGYTYRALTEQSNYDDASHQLTANLSSSTYLWEPWMATTNLALSFTQDSSKTSGAASSATTGSQIITGDLGVNVLPQSKTPFNLQLQFSDSRVDRAGTGMIPITFVGEEYSTTFLGLRQSYITENGGRYRAYMDLRSWESLSGGAYDDTAIGLEADLRWPQQHLTARATKQSNESSLSATDNESLVLDLNHYYYPVRQLRVDSKASVYEYDRSFLDPGTNSTRLAEYYVHQASSFVFWRPVNSPLTVSGGVRVIAMDGVQEGVAANDQLQYSFNAGAFYQMNKHVRLDGGFTSTFRDTADRKDGYHRQYIGGLYQTDWREIKGFMHQGYASGRLTNVAEPDSGADIDTDEEKYIEWNSAVGQSLNRTWWLGERTSATSVRVSVNQAFRVADSGAAANRLGATQRLEHSFTTAFNQRVWGGSTLAQASLSDSRNLGSKTDEQQMFHVQLSRDQDLGRRSSIVGDVTLQYVRSDMGGVEVDTATTTASLEFRHSRMFGVPRLGFVSDLMVSQISTDGLVDRQDWDNRLTYSIGKLDASFSYRLTETDSRNYDLVYFRVMRRF